MLKRLYIFICLWLMACAPAQAANEYYEGAGLEEIKAAGLVACDTPLYSPVPNLSDAEIESELFARGYKLVGIYNFGPQHRAAHIQRAMERGQKLGACLVFYGPTHENPGFRALFALRDTPMFVGLYVTEAPGNPGYFVRGVAYGSPAFSAGLFRSDIIIGINGHAVNYTDNPMNHIAVGKDNVLDILRNGQKMTINMFVPEMELQTR